MADVLTEANPEELLKMAKTKVDAGAVPMKAPGIRKAALLMVALGETHATNMLRQLNEKITRLGTVPSTDLAQVLTEFFGMIETQQYVVRGGLDYAERLFTAAFGADRAEQMLEQLRRARENQNGNLAMLQKMDPQQLSKFLENEHPQTVALVLAHLDARRGSIVLMHLREMRQFSPEMAQTVALVLHRRAESLGNNGQRSYSGFKAVAELLNRLEQTASGTILEEIERKEPKLAIGIRNLMFTFTDLQTVPAQSIRELVGTVDKRVLAIALKGAPDTLRAHLFQAMSSRAVEMMADDMESMGTVPRREILAAQQDILTLARKLEAEGRMILKMEADSDL
jgi:flagellar motor switch protein FliG